MQRIPDSHVNGDVAHRLPNTTNIGFAGLEAEAILLLLSEQDVCASRGGGVFERESGAEPCVAGDAVAGAGGAWGDSVQFESADDFRGCGRGASGFTRCD